MKDPLPLDEWGVIKVSAMTWGEFRETENKTVLEGRAVDPRMEIHPGDLLVSRANTVDYVGAVVMVHECRPRLLLSDKSLRLYPRAPRSSGMDGRVLALAPSARLHRTSCYRNERLDAKYLAAEVEVLTTGGAPYRCATHASRGGKPTDVVY